MSTQSPSPQALGNHIVMAVFASHEAADEAVGASALVGALTAVGVPKNSVLRYETALTADKFLVTVHAQEQDVPRIQQLLGEAAGTEIESHVLP